MRVFRAPRLLGWLLVSSLASALATSLVTRSARAGGFEIPDNGTEALGRGGAFVAKASDGSAIYYNPAGLARQRGTHVLANANLYLHGFEFRRAGVFPDDANDEATPWGGRAYPAVSNVGGPFLSPLVAATTDFNYFDRLTLGVGVFSLPVIGNRTFPLGVDGAPSASRYDFVQSKTSFLMPTLAAGFRVTTWLDVGLSGHLVLANFDQTTVSSNDFGAEICKNAEFQPCDSRNNLVASATAFSATLGALVRPSESVGFGLAFRPPITLSANGTVTPVSPAVGDAELEPGAATLATQLPWMARLGGRYVAVEERVERYDLELDITYEAWGTAQGLGPIIRIPSLGTFKNIEQIVQHRYRDTFSVRGGGAYNVDALGGIFSLRGGAYYDAPATDFGATRVDYDTLAKVAGTFGLGFQYGAFRFDLSYAAVASIPRGVGDGTGTLQPTNDANNGRSVGANDEAYAPVNDGAYRGFTHILSAGIGFSFDSLFGSRVPKYGAAWELEGLPKSEADTEKTKEPEKVRDPELPDEPVKPAPATKQPPKKPASDAPDTPVPPVAPKPKGPGPAKPKPWWEGLD